MKHVDIFSDGSCSGNPGPGGWASILKYGRHEKELCGGESNTTNNRMELTAVIEALNALKEPCDVCITTDSKYVVDGITLGWAEKWKQNGWMRTKKDPALNPDLWDALLSAIDKQNSCEFIWVKGHAGHPENERCDKLAVEQSQKLKDQ
ncbi:MAG: ribonuclease HI [Clostridiales bacterium]|nr:ribonuclease HI [Clostridiales bacterium]